MIRAARMADIHAIHALLGHFADKGLLLGRSLSSLYDQLRDFIVWEEEGEIRGAGALHVCWENLAEIRSLAVAEEHQGRGIGRELVTACLEEAGRLGIDRVFTLTYQAGFFRKMGFVPIAKDALPHKVWHDCIQCPKFPNCTEEALLYTGCTRH